MEVLDGVNPGMGIGKVFKLVPILVNTQTEGSIFGKVNIGIIEELLIGELPRRRITAIEKEVGKDNL
jgi:hypothetical protein